MSYEVTRKYVPPARDGITPGEHYDLRFADHRKRGASLPDFGFYRAPDGREFATEVYGVGRGSRLSSNSEMFAQLKAAVEAYDRKGKPAKGAARNG